MSENNEDKSIILNNSFGISIVNNSLEITNRILFGEISERFNIAFCKMNSKTISEVDKDYLFLLETNPSFRKKSKFDFNANSQNDYNDALEIFENIFIENPHHLISLEMAAICKIELSKFIEAIIDFDNIIDNFKTKKYYFKSDVYYYRGLAKYEINDFQGAQDDFNKMIELDPNDANAYWCRGNTNYVIGDYIGSIEDFTIYFRLNGNDARVYYQMGCSKFELKDFQGAIDDFTMAIKLDSNITEIFEFRGDAKYKLYDYYGSIEDYSKAIEFDSNNARLFMNRALSKFELENYHGAIEDFTEVINLDLFKDFSKPMEIDLQTARAYSLRAKAYMKIGDLENCRKDNQIVFLIAGF